MNAIQSSNDRENDDRLTNWGITSFAQNIGPATN